MTKNEVTIPINLEANFNENDLVTVAVAKGEAMMRQTIRDNTKLVNDKKAEKEKLSEKYQKLIDGTTAPFASTVSSLNEMLKKLLKFQDAGTKTKVIEFAISRRAVHNAANNNMEHTVAFFVNLNGNCVAFASIKQTKEQISCYEKICELDHEINQIMTETIDIKRKLNDIPSLERQMRSRVVELQLSKTTDGRKLLESLTNEMGIKPMLNLLGI